MTSRPAASPGPKGSYHGFAGKDASRAFVIGVVTEAALVSCFPLTQLVCHLPLILLLIFRIGSRNMCGVGAQYSTASTSHHSNRKVAKHLLLKQRNKF